MNTQLEKLFLKHSFSRKDRYDFLQIFALLPDYKKVRVVESFDDIVSQLMLLRNEIQLEQEILFWNTLRNIEKKLSNIRKKKILAEARQNISFLKSTI